MSRFEGKMSKDGEVKADASAEILSALGASHGSKPALRSEAVRCYLSAGDGWKEASLLLGGAFAAGLKNEKDQ